MGFDISKPIFYLTDLMVNYFVENSPSALI